MHSSPESRLSVDEVDRDGALREAAEKVAGDTRAGFFKKGALIGGGLIAGAVPLAIATGQSGLPQGDIDILNFALTLERLESAFYQEAVSKGALSGSLATFASVVAAHESAHVQTLLQTLGDDAGAAPKFDFKGTTEDRAKFAATAIALEDTGVGAYLGQAGKIESPAVLLAAGSILPIEARHAAWIRDINGRGKDPVPAPADFEKPMSKSEVQKAVDDTGFVKS